MNSNEPNAILNNQCDLVLEQLILNSWFGNTICVTCT